MVGLENYANVVKEIKKNKDILLFAVLKMDELTDRWSLLFSTPNFTKNEDRDNLLSFIRKTLADNLSTEDMQDVARIGTFPLDSHLVRDALSYKSETRIVDTKLNGSFIHEGYILISRKPKETPVKP